MSSSKGLNWQDKVKLQKIIAELKFVASDEEIKGYKCIDCDRIALYHYIAECGHAYCGICHGKVHEKRCLADGCPQKVVQIRQDKKFEKKVASLKVHCSFHKNGCQEKIRLRNYSDHVRSCQYSTKNLLPKLYKENDADKQVANQNLSKTIEELQDKIDQLEQQFANFKNQHDLDISNSRTEYKSLKKTIKSTKKDVEIIWKSSKKQENTNALIEKYDEKVTSECTKLMQEIEKQAAEQTDKMKILEKELGSKLESTLEVPTRSRCTQYLWEIEEIEKFFQTWRNEIQESMVSYSETFILNDTELQIKAKLTLDWPQTPGLDLKFTDRRISAHRNPLSLYKCSICIVDQSENAAKRDIWRAIYPVFYSETDGIDFPLALLERKGTNFVKNDSVLVKIILEPLWTSCQSYFSKNGKLLWKINNYRQRKQDAMDGFNMELHSEYFYSSEMGYRMVAVAGFHRAFLGIRLLFVKGEYDDFLKFYFPHRTTLYLFYQSMSQKMKKVKGTHTAQFASFDPISELRYNTIENATYLKNDCLLLEVIVEPE